MEVILLQDVKKIGNAGVVVKVKDGYARNYLIPNKLATPATAGAIKAFEAKKKKVTRDEEKNKKAALITAETLSKMSLTITVESGLNDVLFGSVTSESILHALRQEGLPAGKAGVQMDKTNIIIKEPIKKLGIYNIEVRLHPEVKQEIRVWVVKK